MDSSLRTGSLQLGALQPSSGLQLGSLPLSRGPAPDDAGETYSVEEPAPYVPDPENLAVQLNAAWDQWKVGVDGAPKGPPKKFRAKWLGDRGKNDDDLEAAKKEDAKAKTDAKKAAKAAKSPAKTKALVTTKSSGGAYTGLAYLQRYSPEGQRLHDEKLDTPNPPFPKPPKQPKEAPGARAWANKVAAFNASHAYGDDAGF